MSEPGCKMPGRQGPTHEPGVLRHNGVGRWMPRFAWSSGVKAVEAVRNREDGTNAQLACCGSKRIWSLIRFVGVTG